MSTEDVHEVQDSLTVKDTIYGHLSIKPDKAIRNLDILVYGGSPLLTLESHMTSDQTELELELKDSLPKTIAVLANMPGKLNDEAFRHYDSLEQLEMRLEDDNPDCPFMSGTASLEAGGIGAVQLTPLLCCVLIQSVTNMNDGDVLLENPRARLSGISTRAPLMKPYGFTIQDPGETGAIKLPCDVGLYTQYPNTRLYCYPSDMPGTEAPRLILEYTKEGAQCSFSAEVFPLSRNCIAPLDLYLR